MEILNLYSKKSKLNLVVQELCLETLIAIEQQAVGLFLMCS